MTELHPPALSVTGTTMDWDSKPVICLDTQELQGLSTNPVSPPLTSKGFNELWGDVRAKTSRMEQPTGESVQTTSNLESQPNGASEQNVPTCEQDPEFPSTTLQDLYTAVQEDGEVTKEGVEHLDCYLPRKIVDNTRDQAQELVRRGDTEGACRVRADALAQLEEQLKQQTHVDLAPWKICMADILIDQGQIPKARDVLSEVPRHFRGEQSALGKRHHFRRRTTADAEFEKMMKMTQAETELDRFRRAEDWVKAREAAQELHGIDPSYFNLDKPMDRFNQVRRFVNAGVLKEVEADKASDRAVRINYLSQALEIYNHGCYTYEVYHEFFDANEAIVSGFDHSDCANIFFSAARVCQKFDFETYDVMPQAFRCKGPDLTCVDWKHQALYFLEKGRARALFDSINRGGVVKDVPRRIIKKAFAIDMAEVADAARNVLRTRSSTVSSCKSSRAPTVPAGIPVAQFPTLRSPESMPSSHSRLRSDSCAQPDTSICREIDEKLWTLQAANPSRADTVPSTQLILPTGGVTPTLSEKEQSRMRARINWRRYLLWALTQVNPALDAILGPAIPTQGETLGTTEDERASIPPDTLVVEYALASQAPYGIMVIVAASDAVKEVHWEKANTEEIRICIGVLRDSMEVSESRTSSRQSGSKSKTTRPSGLERKHSADNQKRLDTLLRELVVPPVESHLKGKKKLIIVPSGDLNHVPWRIFFDLPITVVPSLGIWVRLQKKAKAKAAELPKLSIVSTAPEDKQKKLNNIPGYLRDIPFSRIEALYIARLHEQSPFLADDKDHKDLEELARNTQILHICAHSNFEHDEPMSSSLHLFKAPLTIKDWHKLSIRADLVVFSSCLSGISRAYDSGSTIGFAHTLLGTGTRAFIGSLWRVDDGATLLLMAMFYEELRRPRTPADALYVAQERMRRLSDAQLQDVIDDLEHFALRGEATEQFIVNPGYYIEYLRGTRADEWRQEKYWAAFVLTGYGSNTIYPGEVDED